jgi:NADH pyrophosphatase NudC (nudix superfamily)
MLSAETLAEGRRLRMPPDGWDTEKGRRRWLDWCEEHGSALLDHIDALEQQIADMQEHFGMLMALLQMDDTCTWRDVQPVVALLKQRRKRLHAERDALRQQVADLTAKAERACVWTWDDDTDTWSSGCGDTNIVTEDGPSRYCSECGGKIQEGDA